MGGEWTEWAGGECPVPGLAFVSARTRGGTFYNAVPAAFFIDRWSNGWEHTGPVRHEDIIAYRVVQP